MSPNPASAGKFDFNFNCIGLLNFLPKVGSSLRALRHPLRVETDQREIANSAVTESGVQHQEHNQ